MDSLPAQKPDYGIDAPGVIRNLLLISLAGLIVSIVCFEWGQGKWLWLLGVISGIAFLICLAEAIYMICGSKIGKLREREKLLDLVNIRGDEKVLDVGCGRGLLLNAAARRLVTGRAVGIDIWNRKDQSGNHPDVTRRNAEMEGVAEKVEIMNGDARDMPFENDMFDVIVSSLAVHNIYDSEERRKALSEVIRVLKPGGRFAILDFQHVKEYADVLEKLGSTDVEVIGPHFITFPPVRIVTGRKSR